MKWGLARREMRPLHPFEEFEHDVKKIFKDFFSVQPTELFDSAWVPAVDVHEDDKSIQVRAEIPGIDEKDLNITIENNAVTISGQKMEHRDEETRRFLLSERRFGSFQRCIILPEDVKPDSGKASFKNGVLVIDFDKKEVSKPKNITINVK